MSGNLSEAARKRWAGLTAEQRRERTRPAGEAAQAKAFQLRLDRHIDAIVGQAPALTGEQKSRLRLLLDSGQ